MKREKKVVIGFLVENGFTKENAEQYVNSLSKEPDSPPNILFDTVLRLVQYTLKISQNENTPKPTQTA